jgi:hypothetical protein
MKRLLWPLPGVTAIFLAVLMTASASAGVRITVDPNAQYGAHTAWVNLVGENGSQGLVMDNSAPPGAGVPGSFAAAKVSGTNGLSTTGIQLAYDLHEPSGPGTKCQPSQFPGGPWVGPPDVPSFNVEVVYPNGSHHAFWLSCAGATKTPASATNWTTYSFTTEAGVLAGGSVRGMAVFFDAAARVTLDNICVNGTVVGGRGTTESSTRATC